MWTETDLQHDVEKELAWEPSVHPKQISVVVKNGAVDLGGHVDSYWEKCAAEHAAWRVVHVRSVTNTIRVDLPFTALRPDDDIAMAAMTILEWNSLVPPTVDVQVAGAWLTLLGKVEWRYQKVEAERCLSTLRGIQGIHNQIVIEPAVSLGDVRASIDEALKRNALVGPGHIKAHASHGVVSLRGTTRTRAEYEEAMGAAWSAPGVTAVEDHVTIGPVA